MRWKRIELYLGSERREFTSVGPTELCGTLREEATFFDGETLDDYLDWVVANIERGSGHTLEIKGPDEGARCESFVRELVRIGLAKIEE